MAKQRKSFEEQIKTFNPEEHNDSGIFIIEPSSNVVTKTKELRSKGLNNNQIASIMGIAKEVIDTII